MLLSVGYDTGIPDELGFRARAANLLPGLAKLGCGAASACTRGSRGSWSWGSIGSGRGRVSHGLERAQESGVMTTELCPNPTIQGDSRVHPTTTIAYSLEFLRVCCAHWPAWFSRSCVILLSSQNEPESTVTERPLCHWFPAAPNGSPATLEEGFAL